MTNTTKTTKTNRPTITVTTACTCGAKRWFYCTCSTVVARYECAPAGEDFRDEPHPEAIAAARRRHPGMDLVYYGAEEV